MFIITTRITIVIRVIRVTLEIMVITVIMAMNIRIVMIVLKATVPMRLIVYFQLCCFDFGPVGPLSPKIGCLNPGLKRFRGLGWV